MNKIRKNALVIPAVLFALNSLAAQAGTFQVRQARDAFPGEEVAFRFEGANGGSYQAEKDLSLSGLPGDFKTLFLTGDGTENLLALNPGETGEAVLTVGIPPSAEPGSYPFDVRIGSGEGAISFPETIIVKPEDRISLSAAEGTAASEAGKSLEIPLVIRNEGNLPRTGLRYDWEAPVGWKVFLAAGDLESLNPRESVSSSVKIEIPRKQSPGIKKITLTVSSEKGEAASVTIPVEVKQPIRILWVFAGLIGAGLLALALINRKYGRR